MAIGADIEQLQSLQNTLARNSGVVADLTSSIRNELNNVQWTGPAADRFRSDWASAFEPNLKKLQDELDQAATAVGQRRQAFIDAGS
jgi:WXG100 family type VII secretion target